MKINLKEISQQYKEVAKLDVSNLFKTQKEKLIDIVMAQKPFQEIKEQEKAKEINKLMPYIIIGALFLIYIGWKMRK
jgi:hypothetical protein